MKHPPGHISIRALPHRPGLHRVEYKVGKNWVVEHLREPEMTPRLAVIRSSLAHLIAPPTTNEIADYRHAKTLLGDASITEAIQFFFQHRVPRITVRESADKFLATKRKLARCKILTTRMNKLVRHLGPSLAMTEITPERLELFVHEAKMKPTTQASRQSDINNWLSWAKLRGHLPFNLPHPGEGVTRVAGVSKDPVPLSAAALNYLVQHATGDLLTAILLQAFYGVRISEALRLEPEHFGPQGNLYLTSGITKTNRRRVVSAAPCWPFLVPFKSITTSQEELRRQIKVLAEKGSIKLPNNGLRKGFVSHSVMRPGASLSKVAMEAGHSERVLESTYKGLVSPEDAEFWWSILPPRLDVFPKTA